MNVVTATEVIWYGLSFLTALGLVLYVTPLTIDVALAFKIQDTPDGRLKKHTRPTPYLGGLAVAAAFIITFSLLLSNEDTDNYKAMGILAAGLMMMLLGLFDDLSNLRPSVKFLGQVLAALVLYKAQVRIELAALSDTANLLVTILWVTGITNAFNIIDVMDGLASGTACVAALFLFVIALLTGGDSNSAVVPFMAVVLAGALTGFLRFNFAPARIFLGDTGSLFIGFMMGALSMLVSYTDTNRLALFTPMVLLAIPIFDTAFVAWHRARKGIPFFRGSPDHFALRLVQGGWSVRRTALRTYLVGIGLGLASLLLVFGPEWVVPVVLGAVLLGGLVAAVRLSRLPPPGSSPPPRAPA